jgi:hypothetical protein
VAGGCIADASVVASLSLIGSGAIVDTALDAP